MSDDCLLGDYRVTLVKNGRRLSTGLSQLERIQYSRKLDDVSNATVDIVTAGSDCCGQLGAVDHWNTDLVISVGNVVVWRGPVRKARYRRGYVSIEALDVLSWLQVRIMPQDLNFVEQDVSDIFVGLWDSAVASVDPPVYSIVRYNSGVVESRKVEESSHRKAWNIVQEMLDSGLDVTTFGSQIIVGIPAFHNIVMTDRDVQGNIEVVKDGDEFANRVIADAARDVYAIYPPGSRDGSNGYPLVEDTVVDSQLVDVQSAENAAKARYDFSVMGVRRVRADGGLLLLPTAKLDPRTVIAGQLVTFSALETCYQAEETLRLGGLVTTVEKGSETTTIDLQPLGSVRGLGSL